jgi:hypothetical protein
VRKVDSAADGAQQARQARHLAELTRALSALLYTAEPERGQAITGARERGAGVLALALYLNLYQQLTLASALERYEQLQLRLPMWGGCASLGSALLGVVAAIWLGGGVGFAVGGLCWLGATVRAACVVAGASGQCEAARMGRWREDSASRQLMVVAAIGTVQRQLGSGVVAGLPELVPVARQLVAAARAGDATDPAMLAAARLVLDAAIWQANRRRQLAARQERRRSEALAWCALGLGTLALTLLLIWLFSWLVALLGQALRG